MNYKKAEDVLPKEILSLIQDYIDGECIYIPRKKENRKSWGEKTSIKEELKVRNENIFKDYESGISIKNLSTKYFLSEKSIQRIVLQIKKEKFHIV